MTTRDLLMRGFIETPLPKFHGYCADCERYTLMSWWQAIPPDEWRRNETTACKECDTVDQRDVPWIEQVYPLEGEP